MRLLPHRAPKAFFALLAVSGTLFLLPGAVAAQVCAGNWKCDCPGAGETDSGIGCDSAAPDCGCVCGGSCGQSERGLPLRRGPPVAMGDQTKAAIRGLKDCGADLPCLAIHAIVLPITILWDSPVWIGGALAALGHGAAYPFRAMARRRREKLQAESRPVICSKGAGAPQGSFAYYKSWESCKAAILKRQRAMSKLNPGNKGNEEWCRLRIPLSNSSNTSSWLDRCNPGGTRWTPGPLLDP